MRRKKEHLFEGGKMRENNREKKNKKNEGFTSI
jgi:hypothetical protein